MMKNSIALFTGIMISVLALEIFLRLYDPFETRIKGDAIVLPVNRRYTIYNTRIPPLDPIIRHTKNSLGFRGEEPPEDFDARLSLIAVGGSTTEQYYLSDNQTWIYLLGERLIKDFPAVWINNAGLDGHSTFGHAILLEKYVVSLHPDIILFLVGINDIGRADLHHGVDDGFLKNVYRNWLDFTVKKSAFAATVLNIARVARARHAGVAHSRVDPRALPVMDLSPAFISAQLIKEKEYLAGYRNRLVRLLDISRKNGIQPILITQPLLWGAERDPITGVDLGRVKISAERNGALYAELLEAYNEQTRAAGVGAGVPVIDLARALPRDSRYYYDGIHFSKEGAQKVADLLYEPLTVFLKTYAR